MYRPERAFEECELRQVGISFFAVNNPRDLEVRFGCFGKATVM
jgi:hypothetical protein